ncbi:hypothetical protein KDL44_08650 [bacterium]|nr:hypothetical protein [bacterium]
MISRLLMGIGLSIVLAMGITACGGGRDMGLTGLESAQPAAVQDSASDGQPPQLAEATGRSIASGTPPVAVLDMDEGDFTGPYLATLDLSGSFHPDDDPIVEYSFDLGYGIGTVTQTDPVLEILLQPGNYIVNGTCGSDSDNDGIADCFSAPDTGKLSVSPVWESSATPVHDRPAGFVRAGLIQMVGEDDGSSTSFYYDSLVRGISAMHVDPSGVVSYDYVSTGTPGLDLITEPVPDGDGWAFAVSSGGFFDIPLLTRIFTWDGEKLDILKNFQLEDNNVFNPQLERDGNGDLFLFYWDISSFPGPRIVKVDVKTGAEETVLPNLAAGGIYDVEYNPGLDVFDIVYWSGALKWARYDGSTVIDGADITPVFPQGQEVDAAVDPTTDRPRMIYWHQGTVQYSELNADNDTWTAVQPVTPGDFNGQRLRMICADGTTYVGIISFSTALCTVYEGGSAGWQAFNTLDNLLGNVEMAICKVPGDPGIRSMTQYQDWSSRVHELAADDSELLLAQLDGTWGSGFKMQAASATDGLHLLQVRIAPGDVQLHLRSGDGVNWNEVTAPNNSIDHLEVGATDAGELYVTYNRGGRFRLARWTGSSFSEQQNGNVVTGGLGMVSDAGPLRFSFGEGSQQFFNVYTPATGMQFFPITADRIFGGSPTGFAGDFGALVFYGDGNISVSDLGFVTVANGAASLEPVSGIGRNYLGTGITEGSTVDGADYIEPGNGGGIATAWHVNTGPDSSPMRVVRHSDGSFTTKALQFNYPGSVVPDSLFVSSAVQAWGNTFVGLSADNIGLRQHMEWNKGNGFAQLAVPDVGIPLSLPELLVGQDGRWHIIFRDYVNDELLMVSTIE